MRTFTAAAPVLALVTLACSSAATRPPPPGPPSDDAGADATRDAPVGGDASGGPDAALPPATLLAANQNGASWVVLGGNQVVWVNSPAGGAPYTIMGVPKAGGTAVELASQPNVGLIVADDSHVYWTAGHTAIMAVPTARGAPTSLVTGLTDAEGLALDATNLYFDVGTFTNRNIMRVPLAGGAPAPVVMGQDVSRFALDATNVYWMTSSPASLMTAPLLGGPATTLANGPLPASGVSGITADPTGIYWTALDASLTTLSIYKVPLGGGGVTTLASVSGSAFVGGVALDGVSAYVAAGDVYRVPLAGGTPAAVAGGLPFNVAVDGTNVYFASAGSVDPNGSPQSVGSIWKATK
jgi:hypothetical protein